jgi:hypothetical protein
MNDEVIKIMRYQEHTIAILKYFQTIRIEGDSNYNYIGDQNLMGRLEINELKVLKELIDEKKLKII